MFRLQVLFLNLVLIGSQVHAAERSVIRTVQVRNATSDSGILIKVEYLDNDSIVFRNCLRSGTSELCRVIGRESGYSRTELMTRESQLKTKSSMRTAAKWGLPVLGLVGGAWVGGRTAFAQGKDPLALFISIVYGVPAGAVIGGVAGGISSVVITQLTPEYGAQVEALAAGLAKENQEFIIVTGAIEEFVAQLNYALAGL